MSVLKSDLFVRLQATASYRPYRALEIDEYIFAYRVDKYTTRRVHVHCPRPHIILLAVVHSQPRTGDAQSEQSVYKREQESLRSSEAAPRIFPSREIAEIDRDWIRRAAIPRGLAFQLRSSRGDSKHSLGPKNLCAIIKKLWKNISQSRIIRDIISCSENRS